MQLKLTKAKFALSVYVYFLFVGIVFAQTPTQIPSYVEGYWGLRYSFDGQSLPTHTYGWGPCVQNNLEIINTATKSLQWVFASHSCDGYAVWSPSSTYIATSGGDGLIRIWDNNTGIKVMEAYTPMLSGLSSLTWQADESRISALTGDCLECFIHYNVATGERFYQFTIDLLAGLAWHPTNPNIIATVEKDQHLRLYDAQDTLLQDFAIDMPMYGLTWSPDGSRILTFSEPNLLIIDVASGEIESEYTVPPLLEYESLTDFSWTDDGKLILASFDRYIGLWDVKTGDVVFEKVFQTASYSRPIDIRMIDNTHYEIVYAEGLDLQFETVEYGSPTPTPTSTFTNTP